MTMTNENTQPETEECVLNSQGSSVASTDQRKPGDWQRWCLVERGKFACKDSFWQILKTLAPEKAVRGPNNR
jgi:hypothetical protein